MNICIIGPKNSKASLRIKLEAEGRGHTCRRVKLIDIFFEIKNNELVANHRKLNLDEFQVFVFRKINNTEKDEAITLAKYLKSKGKIVIDECLEDICLNEYEVLERLAKAGIPQLNKVRTSGLKTARDILIEFPHPILIKPLDESKERYTVSEDWTDSYDIVRTEKTKRFEIQELIESDTYIKVFVVGNQVVGALKKTVSEKDLRLNYAPKTKSAKYEIDDQVKEIVLKATKVLEYDIASVDLVYKGDDIVVLDIERAPKFKIFNKFFERKFEKLIVDFIESKTN